MLQSRWPEGASPILFLSVVNIAVFIFRFSEKLRIFDEDECRYFIR